MVNRKYTTKEMLFILGGIIIGVYTLMWTSIQLLNWFGLPLGRLKSLGLLGNYFLAVHAILIALIIFIIRFYFKDSDTEKSNHKDNIEESSDIDLMRRNLISAIEVAYNEERFEEVIRFGTALNRPLFISGNHFARLRVGTLVEEVAATTGKIEVQAEMLIDAIGWSHIELGDLESGEENIRHGLSIAQKIPDEYLISRAYRHLGAVERRKNGPPDYGKAEEYFNEALAHANNLADDVHKSETTAGCYYAIASLNFHKKNYSEAIKNLEKAITDFTIAKNDTGITRSLTKKANAYIAIKDYNEAKDLLRKALNRAKKDSHRNQVVRASIGLAEIYIIEKDWPKARKHLELAKTLATEINVLNEIQEIAVLESKLPKEIVKK